MNEEVASLANKGSIQKSDFIKLNRKINSSLILDLTIWFENCEEQPTLLKETKIYSETINYNSTNLYIQNSTVIWDLNGKKRNYPKNVLRFLEGAKFK